LAKTVADHEKDWDTRLPYAIPAFRATRYDTTKYLPNFLVLGRKVRMPVNFVYGTLTEVPMEDCDSFVERIRDRTSTAYSEVRQNLRRRAERNKRYCDINLKPKQFTVRQWVF